jgi:hypothetical protein
MTLVEHVIKGKKYIYDHHRKGDQTVSTYIGPTESVTLQKKVLDSKSLRNNPDYHKAHAAANRAEQKEYGTERFDKLNEEIRKLSDSELAGKHTEEGVLKASTKIDKKFIGQVLFHERIEHNLMARKKK